MMLVQPGQSILTTAAGELINDLADLMEILAEAVTELETQIKMLPLADPSKYTGTEEDIARALEALQEGLTGHTSILLEGLRSNTGLEDLIFAIKLVEAYFQKTSSLENRLSTLSALDQKPHPSYNQIQNLPRNFKCSSKAQDLYEFVPCVRNLLATTLTDILQELNLTKTEVDIESLLQESQKIYDKFKQLNSQKTPPSLKPEKVTPVVKQFINPHLTNAKQTFKNLGKRDITLSSNDLSDIQKLVKSWTKITDILNEITQKEDLISDSNDSRQAIALSLQIDDLLEPIYSDIADIFREQDLLTPGIL
jgi:hypothetical protein